MAFHVPEKHRVADGVMGSDSSFGNNGAFLIPRHGKHERHPPFKVIASDGEGWEHVSVSLPDRCPHWGEMSAIKGLFWDPEDCVMQLHPPLSDYVNCHPYCLHLWRPVRQVIPRPPEWMVA